MRKNARFPPGQKESRSLLNDTERPVKQMPPGASSSSPEIPAKVPNCREPMWPCLSILSWGICRVNRCWKSDFAYWITVMCLRYYEMGFLPMLKETADVSVPLWYEKFNLKGWEKEWCMAYFHSPTPGDMRMMFCCVQEMMPIVLQRNSFIIQFNFF